MHKDGIMEVVFIMGVNRWNDGGRVLQGVNRWDGGGRVRTARLGGAGWNSKI